MRNYAIEAIHAKLKPLGDDSGSLNPLIQAAGKSSMVLIGEASHGTHEFYRTRAEITKRLIRERGFQAVAVEADWPDAYRVDKYVRGRSDDRSPEQALSGFQRFPRWMWRNRDVEEFIGWLREYNDSRAARTPETGFYGIDLYSLYSSRDEVIRYLERVDRNAAKAARERYSCFDHYGGDPQAYGMAALYGVSETCEDEVVKQLTELRKSAYAYMHRDGHVAEDEFFSAEQNARLVKNAEEYYRSMFRGRVSSWNLRDNHMAETLGSLRKWLERRYGQAKIVVWEHNSHIGDARATGMGERGEHNVGQLIRQQYPGETYLVGFSTYEGTVMAASDWDGEAEIKNVRPGATGSWEDLFHQVGLARFLLIFSGDPDLAARVGGERLERAIGVIYRPQTERASHYFYARIAEQFDAAIHIDITRAVEPLDVLAHTAREEVPETFPTGL